MNEYLIDDYYKKFPDTDIPRVVLDSPDQKVREQIQKAVDGKRGPLKLSEIQAELPPGANI